MLQGPGNLLKPGASRQESSIIFLAVRRKTQARQTAAFCATGKSALSPVWRLMAFPAIRGNCPCPMQAGVACRTLSGMG